MSKAWKFMSWIDRNIFRETEKKVYTRGEFFFVLCFLWMFPLVVVIQSLAKFLKRVLSEEITRD